MTWVQLPVSPPLTEEAIGVGVSLVRAAVEVEGLGDLDLETASSCRDMESAVTNIENSIENQDLPTKIVLKCEVQYQDNASRT